MSSPSASGSSRPAAPTSSLIAARLGAALDSVAAAVFLTTVARFFLAGSAGRLGPRSSFISLSGEALVALGPSSTYGFWSGFVAALELTREAARRFGGNVDDRGGGRGTSSFTAARLDLFLLGAMLLATLFVKRVQEYRFVTAGAIRRYRICIRYVCHGVWGILSRSGRETNAKS